jgi:hypothetical protein
MTKEQSEMRSLTLVSGHRHLLASAILLSAVACADAEQVEDDTDTTYLTSDAGSTSGTTDSDAASTGSTSTSTVSDAGTVNDASSSTTADAGSASTDAGGTGTGSGSGPTSCTVSCTTSNSSSQYSGTYGYGAWIQNSAGKAVALFEAHSKSPHITLRYYNTAASGVTDTDVVTGASIKGSIDHTYSWNITGTDGQRLANGDYTLVFEMLTTSGDSTVKVPFTLGSTSVSATGADTSTVKSAKIVCQ